MPKTSTNPLFPAMKRLMQDTDSHCGPAVIAMLSSVYGITVIQHDIVMAAKVENSFEAKGMTIPDLGKGLITLHPELSLWYKKGSSVDELDIIINTLHMPVGVEWQGSFGEYADDDNGHYSAVTGLDISNGTITLSDPFEIFAGTDRVFPLTDFIGRWWDINEVTNYSLSVTYQERDDKTLFVVAKTEYEFPKSLELHRYILGE